MEKERTGDSDSSSSYSSCSEDSDSLASSSDSKELSDSEELQPIDVEMTTVREVCHGCSLRTEFGFRPRDTFDSLEPTGCTCFIDDKGINAEFVRWMKYHNLLGSLPLDPTTLTQDKIRDAMMAMSRTTIIEGLSSTTIIDYVSHYVGRVSRDRVGQISPWEYYDVGCGNAKLSRGIAERLGAMTRHCDVTDMRIGKYTTEDYEDFSLFDGERLNISDEEVRVVTCLLVLHHSTNPQRLFEEVHRVLKPGGLFIIREMDCRSWERAYAYDYMHQTLGNSLLDDMSVVTYRTREGWRELASAAGFSVVEGTPPQGAYQMYFDVFQKNS